MCARWQIRIIDAAENEHLRFLAFRKTETRADARIGLMWNFLTIIFSPKDKKMDFRVFSISNERKAKAENLIDHIVIQIQSETNDDISWRQF